MPDADTVRRIALSLPEVTEGPCYGTPGWRVKKKLMGRLLDDPRHFVVKVDFGEREALTQTDPGTFFITPHYENYPMVIVNLTTVDEAELGELITEAWRRCATKRLREAFDEADG